MRLSSDDLAAAVVKGALSTGLNVYDIGVCPTPLQYFSLFHLHLDGGIMVTGSHNPPEYNGFKLSIGKDTIHGTDIQILREIITCQQCALSSRKGEEQKYDIVKAYKEYMLKEFSPLDSPQYKRLRVVIDAGNGTAGAIVPDILESIGCEVIPLYCEPDGSFPNHLLIRQWWNIYRI